MKNNRPVNLPISQVISVNLKSPVAIASILHRVSGIVLFLLVPVLLWMFQTALSSPVGFDYVKEVVFGNILVRFVVWIFVAGILYHFVMGMKHLFADAGVAEELESGRRVAWVSLAVAISLVLASFVWIMF